MQIVVVAVSLGLIGAFSYSAMSAGMGTSRRGKYKVKAVSVVQAVTEELTSSNLKPYVGRGDIACDEEWIPKRYSVR